MNSMSAEHYERWAIVTRLTQGRPTVVVLIPVPRTKDRQAYLFTPDEAEHLAGKLSQAAEEARELERS
jgi:hypothetical protein